MATHNIDSKLNLVVDDLSELKSIDGNKDLYTHLKEMYKVKRELNDDIKFNDLFEDISIRIKKNGKYYNDNCNTETQHKAVQKMAENIQKSKQLLKPLVKVEGEETTPITQINYIPDYYTLFQQLSWCGIYMGDKEGYLLNNSLRNLASTLPGSIAFVGKVYGTKKDYYIVEATDIDPPEGFEYPADMEQRKADGVNRNVYYVTNDLTEDWKQLPDVTANQIVTSRNIKYIFTGILDTNIYSNPKFNGQEKHLLHCQLSRIYHGTKLVPTINHYTVESPEEPFKPLVPNTDNNPKKFTHFDLVKLSTWIHYPPSILKQGRVNHYIVVPEDVQDQDEYRKKEVMKDPFEKRIKPVVEDNIIYMNTVTKLKVCPWKLTQHFENNVYTNPYIKLLDESQPDFDPNEQKDNKVDYSIICVKSLLWPGAYNVYYNKECYFFYFGFGQKYNNTVNSDSYNYKFFPKILNEINDKVERDEPNEPKPKAVPSA